MNCPVSCCVHSLKWAVIVTIVLVFNATICNENYAIMTQVGQEVSSQAFPGTFNGVVLVDVIPNANDLLAGIPVVRGTGSVLEGGEYVLTAAHLFDGLINAKTDITVDDDSQLANNFNLIPGNTLFIHPDYTPNPLKVGGNPQAWGILSTDPAQTGALGGYDVAVIKLPQAAPANISTFSIIAPRQDHNGSVVALGYGFTGNGFDGFNTATLPPLVVGGGRTKVIGLNEWDGSPMQPVFQPLLKNQDSMRILDFDNGNPANSFVGSNGLTNSNNQIDAMPVVGDSGGPHLITGAKIAGVQSWQKVDGLVSDSNAAVGWTFGEVSAATWLGADNLDNPATLNTDESEETIVDWIRSSMGKASAKNGGSWDDANTWAFSEIPTSSNDVFIDRVTASTTVITGPNTNSQVRSLQVGGSDGDKQLRLESAVAMTSANTISIQDNGLLQARNGTLVADSVSLAASPSAQFSGELLITGDLGASSVNVTNEITLNSGGLLSFFGVPATTSLSAARIIINGTGRFLTNRVGGGTLDTDWEINGFVNSSSRM